MNRRGRPFERLRRPAVTSSDDVAAVDWKRHAGAAGLTATEFYRILAEKLGRTPQTGHSPDDYGPDALP
jgi:hypothetical protein